MAYKQDFYKGIDVIFAQAVRQLKMLNLEGGKGEDDSAHEGRSAGRVSLADKTDMHTGIVW